MSALPIRPRVTLRDLAAAAGVSKTVASRALSGYADVAPATRERVARLARELGYHASARARALAAGKDAPARCAVLSLGMTPVQFGRSFYGPVLAGIAAQAAAEAMEVQLLTISAEEAATPETLGRLVAEDRADGFIVLTFLPLQPDDVRPFAAAQVPYVLVNRHFGERPVNCVTPDWRDATCRAVGHLAARGHRRLAAIFPDSATSSVRDREDGWRVGLVHQGIDPAEAPILRYQGPGPAGGRRLARQLVAEGLPASGHRPTGIVCFDDFCAHGVLAAAVEAGLRVPGQLSVVGFDNGIAAYTAPPLCSFDPHLHDLGAAAASLLAATMRDATAKPRMVRLPLDLICRESCGPASGLPGG